MRQVDARPYAWPFDGPHAVEATALLVLGLQRAPLDELGGAGDAALEKLCALLGRWRAVGGLALWGRRGVTAPEDLSAPQRWRNDRRSHDRVLVRGAAGWDLALEPRPREPVIDHAGDDAFFGSDLGHLLARRAVRGLLIAGFRTDGIVHATMRHANDQGFECLLVEDATATDTDDLHRGILAITTFGGGLFGTIATASAVLAALGGNRR